MLPYFFYKWIVLILFSRFKALGSNFIDFFAKVLIMNPFFLLYILLPSLSTLWSIVPDVTLRAGIAFSVFTAFGFYLAAQYTAYSRFMKYSSSSL